MVINKGIVIDDFIKIGNALNNPFRIKIMKLCETKEETITDIKQKMKMTYSKVHNNIYILEKAGLIETRYSINEKGKIKLVKALYRITKDKTLEKI